MRTLSAVMGSKSGATQNLKQKLFRKIAEKNLKMILGSMRVGD